MNCPILLSLSPAGAEVTTGRPEYPQHLRTVQYASARRAWKVAHRTSREMGWRGDVLVERLTPAARS